MVERIRPVIGCVGQHIVKKLRVYPYEYAEERGNRHCQNHVTRGFFGLYPLILAHESMIRKFKGCGEECAGGSERKKQPRERKVFLRRRRNYHGFAHKSGKNRHARYRDPPYHIKDKGKGHFTVYAAQFRGLAFSRHKNNGARSHKKKRLIDYMRERMGGGAVYGHLGSYADGRDHVPDLAYYVIRKKPPYIVFHHCVDNPVYRHNHPEPEKHFRPRETADKDIEGALCRKRRHEYRPGYCRLGVRIGQPCGKRRHSRIEDETYEDKGRGKASHSHVPEGKASGLAVMEEYPCHKAYPPEHMDKDITECRIIGLRCIPVKNEEYGRKRHKFPEDKKRKEIPGKYGPDGASRIYKARHMMSVFFYMKPIHHAHECRNRKNIGKDG